MRTETDNQLLCLVNFILFLQVGGYMKEILDNKAIVLPLFAWFGSVYKICQPFYQAW